MRKGETMKMKKRSTIILVIMALLLGVARIDQAKAQVGIFIMDDEEYANIRGGSTEPPDGFIIPDFPNHDETWDVSPIGNGLWLLGCLGGAYLLGKRRKREDEE